MRFLGLAVTAALAAFALAPIAIASSEPSTSGPARSDLADLVAGEFHGDVISDARGASRSDVTVTVTKTARNTVTVASDYSRLPEREFKLTRALDTIQNVGGEEVFLLELNKDPVALSLTVDEASWAGTRAKDLD